MNAATAAPLPATGLMSPPRLSLVMPEVEFVPDLTGECARVAVPALAPLSMEELAAGCARESEAFRRDELALKKQAYLTAKEHASELVEELRWLSDGFNLRSKANLDTVMKSKEARWALRYCFAIRLEDDSFRGQLRRQGSIDALSILGDGLYHPELQRALEGGKAPSARAWNAVKLRMVDELTLRAYRDLLGQGLEEDVNRALRGVLRKAPSEKLAELTEGQWAPQVVVSRQKFDQVARPGLDMRVLIECKASGSQANSSKSVDTAMKMAEAARRGCPDRAASPTVLVVRGEYSPQDLATFQREHGFVVFGEDLGRLVDWLAAIRVAASKA